MHTADDASPAIRLTARPPRFELYERNHGRGKSDKEYSIKLSLSEGAHSSNVLDSALDARHSLNVQPRRKLTQHLPYSLVIERLSKHFGRVSDVRTLHPPLICVKLTLLHCRTTTRALTPRTRRSTRCRPR